MTIDRTRGRATNQNELVEEPGTFWSARIFKSQSPVQKTPRNGREVHEMWKARAPARTEVCSQECKVQGMPQNRALPQGMPIQEKRQKS